MAGEWEGEGEVCWPNQKGKIHYTPEVEQLAPEKWWLEDNPFPFWGPVNFQGEIREVKLPGSIVIFIVQSKKNAGRVIDSAKWWDIPSGGGVGS